jgi:hypothetical protein
MCHVFTVQIIARLGQAINHPDSVYYWAWKNNIPVFCPAITDGSIGEAPQGLRHSILQMPTTHSTARPCVSHCVACNQLAAVQHEHALMRTVAPSAGP